HYDRFVVFFLFSFCTLFFFDYSLFFFFFFFFFYLFLPPPDLHSFPTRRSSDLGIYDAIFHLCLRSCFFKFLPEYTNLQKFKKTRSEEHTSELQSLRHLVCRLLLEKKKK